jgi:hypothetical protein
MYSILATAHALLPRYDQWPLESIAFSSSSTSVIGQLSVAANTSNQGLARPNASTLAGPIPNLSVGGPVAAAFAGMTCSRWIRASSRAVVSRSRALDSFISADRILGQLDFGYNSQNLLEGREVGFSPNANSCLVNGAPGFSVRRPRGD